MSTLKELREEQHMSKAQLARQFGVTERTIYSWEKGDPVKPLVVLAYAELFDTDPTQIDAPIVGLDMGGVRSTFGWLYVRPPDETYNQSCMFGGGDMFDGDRPSPRNEAA